MTSGYCIDTYSSKLYSTLKGYLDCSKKRGLLHSFHNDIKNSPWLQQFRASFSKVSAHLGYTNVMLMPTYCYAYCSVVSMSSWAAENG